MVARRQKKGSRSARASWQGMLRFGLVVFPVEAFNARVRDEGEVSLNQLHAPCHNRIRYEKHCPVHGKVPNNEIVSAYQYAKDQYVEIDSDELDALRTDAERALTIDSFVSPEEIDPIYLDGRMYYLAPDGREAAEPYLVFLNALQKKNKVGVGQVVFSGREQVVQVRPYGEALLMEMLNYAVEIRPPEDVLPELPAVREAPKKVRLAEQLIETWSEEKFDFAQYEDQRLSKLKELVEAKVEGREVVTPPEAKEAPPAVDLMDALRQSVKQADRRKPRPSKTPPKQTSAARRTAKRKR